jgi:hypothetical protein
MRDHIDPQPWGFTLAHPAIEQIDLFGDLRKQGIERLVQDLEARDFGVAQLDDDADAIGGFDPRLPERIAQPRRSRVAGGLAGILRV